MRYLALFILLPALSFGQTVSTSPISIPAWGNTEDMGSISIEYKNVGIHYFHVYKPMECCVHRETREWLIKTETQSTLGASYSVSLLHGVFKPGALITLNKFPIKEGTHLNFIFDIGYSFDRFRISYRHISNGFGLQNSINVGMDSINLSIKLGR